MKEIKKQASWFKTEVDFENSFKWWFALQWQNKFIQIFIVVFIATIVELVRFGWVIDTVSDNYNDEGFFGAAAATLGLMIPPAVMLIVAYKGFYQYFDDMKNGNSR